MLVKSPPKHEVRQGADLVNVAAASAGSAKKRHGDKTLPFIRRQNSVLGPELCNALLWNGPPATVLRLFHHHRQTARAILIPGGRKLVELSA